MWLKHSRIGRSRKISGFIQLFRRVILEPDNERGYKPCVYILSSESKRLYVGITSDLVKRTFQHKKRFIFGHPEKYEKDKLVYFVLYDDPTTAIQREKQLKHWKREWKLDLIKNNNSNFNDLSEDIIF